MKLKIFIQRFCPYCIAALQHIKRAEQELGKSFDAEIIDELKDPVTANQYDYYFVPSFYVDEEKVHEGAVDYNQVLAILQKIK